jgi:hypothetical protein
MFQQVTSYNISRMEVEDLKYRQRLMQIPGVVPMREIIQAIGEEQIYHDALRPRNNDSIKSTSANNDNNIGLFLAFFCQLCYLFFQSRFVDVLINCQIVYDF